MNESVVLGLGADALWTAFLIGAPILGMTLVIGVVISIVQAVTQVNEMTLTFVPKFIGVFVALLVFGPWMPSSSCDFTVVLFANLAGYRA
ncbi:MAG: flagellar biosynthesis protein FliQ [Dehalococcoidia bacterium]|nr:flagellar biosynthesis protein FliQ [Dehalococcoidia bacterium]